MATMLKVHKEAETKEEKITPEYIRDNLFYFHDAAHKFHQNTTSGWEHDAMGKLYEGLAEFRDDIPEKIMGYMGGKRIEGLEKLKLPEYTSKKDSVNLCNELITFSYEVYEWAGENKFCDVENKAQELSGVAAKTVYRLTLS